ncbi:hypothetical protein RRG08_004332 [Elysia crispata]|uniref:Uncharacterized protein n=1 Tax=Elysia crispata TaxID=231223 RepID=A0AAE1AXW1_9GAST|nr:hypothetical protein RRG08_004332 [Elysia crispata]
MLAVRARGHGGICVFPFSSLPSPETMKGQLDTVLPHVRVRSSSILREMKEDVRRECDPSNQVKATRFGRIGRVHR